jgi:hypothetical protein
MNQKYKNNSFGSNPNAYAKIKTLKENRNVFKETSALQHI